ncbi:uncharacterized protein A4U43_C01F21530 [Asparagus officinalis]|uniref:Auxin-responsive protein n=1 Tax=Asparagus officinalis TaxID=4686 RepID=A0A5P1FUS5_ASPOF|nr:auxin-responsive protein IAA18-like [Asparagus officinalis]ONK80769.1 uncharacterized protein A4U43_C01F21530 [Asparagus officinalis]
MDEKKLELRLGPPGDDEYPAKTCVGAKRGFFATVEPNTGSILPPHATENAAEGQRSSRTRTATAPVVGWPPIRSFRKNLASSSSKSNLETPDESLKKTAKPETNKGLFVKINMDGIPIGRKIDLKAYNSYDKLSLAVDELFRGLLAAQRDPIATGSLEKEQAITGLLDGSGEFTLVYEDDEGDRMLVGDVPWEMFVSTARRLRVLKSSELSTLRSGIINKKRTAEC